MSCVIVIYGLKQSRENNKPHIRILNSIFLCFYNEVLAEFKDIKSKNNHSYFKMLYFHRILKVFLR